MDAAPQPSAPAMAKDKASDAEEKPHFTLHVTDLAYNPPKTLLNTATEYLRSHLNSLQIGWVLPSLKQVSKEDNHEGPLYRVHFSAKSGELTAILGDKHERRSLVELIGGRITRGTYEGDIQVNGPGVQANSYYYDHIAYVQAVSFS
jgi:ABC-type transport system involved in cytochrome bd biosynthesis fused ATPase/permease subunit